MYRPLDFGIYYIDAMKVVEGIYAYNFNKHSNLNDSAKSFLIKTGRKPTDEELDFQKRLEAGEKAPHNAYWFNWCCYSAQNIFVKHPHLIPSTKEVKDISENTFGHSLDDKHIYNITSMLRTKMFKIVDGIFGVNVWQIMGVVASLDCNSIPRNDKYIALLFNKIYKREPISQEISCCKTLDLSKDPEELRNEIKSIVKVEGEDVVSKRRFKRNGQVSG